MPTVRFKYRHTGHVQQTEALPKLEPKALPVPSTLPPGYTQAMTATRQYRRSYTRLSRSMQQTYGPIPRDIPPDYLHTFAPSREAHTEALIIPDDDTASLSTPQTPSVVRPQKSTSSTLVMVVCVILAAVLIGSWLGSLFVSSLLPTRPQASQAITRIAQLDSNQYTSQDRYTTWAESACSAAAMTEVINAYGHTYRIADILSVEANQQQITPELGLLYGASSVARTVAPFGFSAHALEDTSLDNILSVANSGTPVIVGFMDKVDFPTGHILVVKGGSGDTVNLVDSSKLNWTSLSRTRFLHLYDGFAVLVTPNNATPSDTVAVPTTGYSVLGPPSISSDMINRILDTYHSPAKRKGQTLYDLGVKYGIDPAFALAFFMNESSFGTQGMATSTLALGNERCLSDRPCVNTQGLACETGQSCYAQFLSWEDGFEHWYQLITGSLYKGSGLTTVATIIPKYAPGSDHNDVDHYIAAVTHAVDTWRSGKVVVA